MTALVMFGERVLQQPWVLTVLLFSSTCPFIHINQTSYMRFTGKKEKKLARSFNFISAV